VSQNEAHETVKSHDLKYYDHLADDGTMLRAIRIDDEEFLRGFCQQMIRGGGLTQNAANELFIRCRNEFAQKRKVWVDVEMGPMKTVRGAFN
jgi:hypothetical protein